MINATQFTVLALLRPQNAADILGLEIFIEFLDSMDDKLSITVESSSIDPSVTMVFCAYYYKFVKEYNINHYFNSKC